MILNFPKKRRNDIERPKKTWDLPGLGRRLGDFKQAFQK